MTTPATPTAVVDALRAAGCVFAEDEARLLTAQARSAGELATMVSRRVAGLPLEQVLGWAEFCGLRIHLAPGVFVPRQRTGFLVERAVAAARGLGTTERLVVVDLCCGAGAIGVALATALPAVELHSADLDPAAVSCARRNVLPIGGQVHQGDLYQPLPTDLRGRVQLLTANTPYVPTGEVDLLPREAREHEPRLALDGGPDGLTLLRRISATAVEWLAPGGHLLIETSTRQVPAALAAFTTGGLHASVATCAERDATVVLGAAPAGLR